MGTTFAQPSNVEIETSPANAPAGLRFAPSPEWPDWFQAGQRAAWERFLATPMPGRHDEAWRFGNIKALALDEFVPAPEIASEGRIINASAGIEQVAAKLVFANNTLVHRQGDGLPPGVLVLPLAEAVREHPDLIREYFMAQPVKLGSHKFALLHRALVRGGALVFVPKNTEVALPIELFHWIEGANAAVFPHTLVILADNSKATVIDHFHSADGARAFACAINDFHIGPGAQLSYAGIQDWSRESLAIHLNSTVVARDATSTALGVNFGGGYVRAESLSRLVGEGGRSVMLSLNPMDGRRELDQRTLQDHACRHASSDLLYRNALDDASHTIFSGLIRVEPGSLQTDGYQKVENLVLTNEAVAHSMPGLQIQNDDVRCTHGATTGGLSAEELFYMQARGIPTPLARKLIVAGFFHSLLDRVTDPTLRHYAARLVDHRLGIGQ